ncbi:Ig-like domain-containing protein [Flavobacterium sp. SM2513]|uniref:Ig-like domain-containing protein n=1 Tax=Flavobacterium sp. SM2513 TaxID=3424766 RepID=UPI003D7FCA78
MKKLILLLFVGILPLFGFAQNNPVVSWNGRLIDNAPSFKPTYLTNTTDSGVSSAALSAQDISSMGVGTLSVVSWESFYGTGWPGNSNVDSGKYFALTVSPKTNYQLALSKLVLTYKGNNNKMRVSYSKNANFSNPTNIEFTNLNIYNTPVAVDVNFPTTVNVTSSETLYIRIYGYDNAVNGNGNGNSTNRYWSLQFNANNPSSNVGPTLYGTVTSSSVPQAPVANSDTVLTLKNVPATIDVLANDVYSNLTTSLSITQQSANGNVIVNSSNQVVFTPTTDYVGTTNFKYKITDSNGTSNEATVTIQVKEPVLEPLVLWNNTDKTATIPSNNAIGGDMIANDGISISNIAYNNTSQWFQTGNWPNPQYSSGTLNESKYIEYSITAKAGTRIDLGEFKFNYNAQGTSQSFQVRYSTDNFNTYMVLQQNQAITNTSWNVFSKSLSNIAPLLEGNTLKIRVYAYNTYNNFNIKRIKNLTTPTDFSETPMITGIVSAAQESITTWNGEAGWSNGAPSITRDAIIEADYQVATNEVLAIKNLTINANAKVTVASNATLLIQNNVTIVSNNQNEAPRLIIENNGSFVQVNDNATFTGATNSFLVKKNTQPVFKYDYTYWSSPVKADAGFTLNTLSPLTTPTRYMKWRHTTSPQAWEVLLSGNEVMVPGRGYIVRAPATYNNEGAGAAQVYPANFIGHPNNGQISHPVTGSENTKAFNLIGNPYPSAMDATKFLDENKQTLSGTLYFWTHNTEFSNSTNFSYTPSDYASWNRTGGTATNGGDGNGNDNASKPSGYIAAGQSFFVQGIGAGAGTVVFNNEMRVKEAGLNNQFFKPAPTQPVENWQTTGKHRVWLNLTSAQNDFNQALVGYIENATNELDLDFDGEVFSGGAVSLYSIAEAKKLTIQGRALPFSNQDEVPLGYKTTLTGTLTISIEEFDGLLAGQNIYIKDNVLGTVHNLKEADYTFTTVPGTFDDRFVLRYLPQETLGTDLPTINANSVVVFNSDNQISIKSTELVISKIEIFDLQGRVVFTKNNIDAQAFATQTLSVSNQMVIVKVTTDNNAELVKKVMLK